MNQTIKTALALTDALEILETAYYESSVAVQDFINNAYSYIDQQLRETVREIPTSLA